MSKATSGAAEEFELVVDRPANGGEAIGRVDDRVVFVRGAVPGERVRVRVTDDRHTAYRRAEVVDVLDPSPHRRPYACPAAAHGGGCCDLSFIDVGHLRDLQTQVLLDVLTRIGGLDPSLPAVDGFADVGVEALSATATGWRVRTRLGVGADGRAGVRTFRGATVLADHPCVQPEPGMTVGLDAHRLTPGADLVVVADADGARHLTEVAPPPAGRRRRAAGQRGRAQSDRRQRSTRRSTRVVEGSDTAVHRVGTREWRIPVTGFWQAHRQAPSVYSQAVVDLVAEAGATGRRRVVWDLYGGAGVFAAALLDREPGGGGPPGPVRDVDPDSPVHDVDTDTTVHVVDTDTEALAAATAAFDGDDRVRVRAGGVAQTVSTLPRPDVVVLDPPRSGAGADVVDAIAAAGPSTVVHVGCDAARFARDLALFAGHGYQVRRIRGFDAFPLTHHVEAIALLVR
ncbi:class I SAM-dependent RNA methyltransferase [Gordonia soli]|uniref:Putative RNA methyltransferase n=1 Tax=Gordonia soli NBRC 108243 TaxID=1223545 RepID=M0QKV0_9ACTN|nr:TRAM domain-containing protein [Gordonia soli]GAC68886.1 putative RNA methyltransferase [Gordonia soli NBRC 108243]